MKKKATLLITIAALVTMAIVGGTLAWFTSTDVVTNILKTGKISVQVTEPNYVGKKGGTVCEIVPGQTITKDPTIKNLGDDAQIRYRVNVTLTDFNDKPLLNKKGEIVPLPTGNNALKFKWASGEAINVPINQWVDLEEVKVVDGKNVVDKVVKEGAAPTKLFDSVYIPSTWGNEYQEAKLTITVDVQALQADTSTSKVNWAEAFETSTPK